MLSYVVGTRGTNGVVVAPWFRPFVPEIPAKFWKTLGKSRPLRWSVAVGTMSNEPSVVKRANLEVAH